MSGKINKIFFEVLKAKIFSTTIVNVLTGEKKNPSQSSIKKTNYFVFVFVFVGK